MRVIPEPTDEDLNLDLVGNYSFIPARVRWPIQMWIRRTNAVEKELALLKLQLTETERERDGLREQLAKKKLPAPKFPTR